MVENIIPLFGVEEMKTRKIKTPRQKLILACDKLYSLIIRKRDPICVYCGKNPTRQCAHIFSRRYLSTRWDFKNAMGMCGGCHIFQAHVNPIEFHDFAKRKIGEKEYDRLRAISLMTTKIDLSMCKIYLTKYLEEM